MKKLLFIVLLAGFLRIHKIDQIPPSMSWDEVSIGYNAFSILTTGKDEHGRFLPFDTFTAYGDYKPPVPVYVTIPFVAVFGLNETAVRLPSALAGTLTVLGTYFLVLELFGDNKNKTILAVLTALLLAISPWHMQLSRAGFEANIALLFIVVGVYTLLRSRVNPQYLVWGWIPFILAMYTFNSARYFAPIFSLTLVWYIWETVKKNHILFLQGILVACVLMLPILPHLVSREARLRYTEVNIFNDYPLILTSNNRRMLDKHSFAGKIFHNHRVVYARSYMTHFLDNLQPWFLFIRGDGNPKFSTQNTGQLYLIEAPFLLYGLYLIIAQHRKTGILLLIWLLGSIAPAAVARETPHALRIENSLPAWQICISLGIFGFLDRIRRKIVTVGLVCLYLFSFGYFTHGYFFHYTKEYSGEWQYGYKQAITYTESVKQSYDSVVLSDVIGRPYMYALFYGKYQLADFWKDKKSYFDADGFYHVDSFGKYHFTSGGIGAYPGSVLYVLPPAKVPKNAKILKHIHLLNGIEVLTVFEV